MDEDLELPPSLAAAWGLRGRPQKGPRPALSLDRIVDAAVSVAASEGLAAVSMSRVAAVLGASTMSLYRYVAAKDELLALMLDVATGPPPELPSDVDGWRAGLNHWAWSIRRGIRRHPWMAHLPLSGPPITPHQIAWLEQGLHFMAGTGLADTEKLSVIMLISGYVWRESTLAVDIMSAMNADNKWQQISLQYSATLAKLIDNERFPEVSRLIGSSAFDQPDHPDAEFIFGLARILDGIDILVQDRSRRGRKRRPPSPPRPLPPSSPGPVQ